MATPTGRTIAVDCGEPLGNPLISVVIPAFNAAKTLDATLDSVWRQSLSSWEALIVDDGSTDGTRAVVRRWADRDPRFRYIRQPNGGASRARNTGIKAAKGRYLVFLDADDWIAEEHFARLTALAASEAVNSVAYCAYVRVTPEGNRTPPDWCPELQDSPFEFLAQRCEPAIHCLLVRKTLVEDVGAFDPELKTCEDWDLWLRIARSGARFVGTPEPLAFYRMRNGSLSTNADTVNRDALKVLERAGKADPRVPQPDPRYANGLTSSGNRKDLALARLAAIAERAAAGQDWRDALRAAADLHLLSDDAESVAALLYQAATGGAAIVRDDARRAFPTVKQLTPFLDALAPPLECGADGSRLMAMIERMVLHSGDLSAPVQLDSWMGMQIDLRVPLSSVALPAHIRAIHIRVCAGTQHLGGSEIPAFGAIGAADVAKAIAADIPLRALLQPSILARHPRLWFTVPIALPSAAWRMARHWKYLPAHGLRILRGYLRESLKDAVARGFRKRRDSENRKTRSNRHNSESRYVRPPEDRTGIAQSANGASCRHQVPIILFPQVGYGATAIAPALFAAQIAYLRSHNYETLSLDTLKRHRRTHTPVPGRPVLITFDDPRRAFLVHAWPVLKQSGFRAFLFVDTPRIGQTATGESAPLAWDDIRTLLEHTVEFGLFMHPASVHPFSFDGVFRAVQERRALFETQTGHRLTALSAAAEFSERVWLRLFEQAGFAELFTTHAGLDDVTSPEPFFPRIDLHFRDSLGMFVEKLRYGSVDTGG